MSKVFVNCGYCGYGGDASKWWHWRCKSCPTVFCSPACFRYGKMDHDYFCHSAKPSGRKPFNNGSGSPQLTRVFENTALKSRQATPNTSQDDPGSRDSSRQRSYDTRPPLPRRNDRSNNPNLFKPANLQSNDDDPRSKEKNHC